MAAYVVDVNVGVVANGCYEKAGPSHRLACIQALRCVMNGLLCLDSGGLILREYRKRLSLKGQPGVGDEFVFWAHQNQYTKEHCERTAITSTQDDDSEFVQFPCEGSLSRFDRSDRKYAAVALASKFDPEILNASDKDWWEHRVALKARGLRITFLCPDLMS